MHHQTHRFTPDELRQYAGCTVPDIIAPGLTVLFCGINPGLYTAATGHHFARPGNRFWPALYRGGFTPRLLGPAEDGLLPAYGLGITNVVQRASASAAELTRVELEAGAQRLEKTVLQYAPAWLAVLGVGAYRQGFGDRRAQVGLQHRAIGSTRIWLLPNPSGLNAHVSPQMFADAFARFRAAVQAS